MVKEIVFYNPPLVYFTIYVTYALPRVEYFYLLLKNYICWFF